MKHFRRLSAKQWKIILISALLVCLFGATGTLWYMQRPATEQLPILLYHSVAPVQELNPANLYTLDVEQFKAHMKYLHDNGFQTITTEQLSDLLYRKKKLPPKSVMITFDDGIANNLEYAYPVLKEYGFHAVEYVITSYVKQEAEPFAPGQRQFMNLPRMKECGDVFEYQSHTDNMHYYHTPGSPILLNAAEDEIRMDLRKSFDLPQMKKTSFAFPYGGYDKRLLRSAARAEGRAGHDHQALLRHAGFRPHGTGPIHVPQHEQL